MSDSSVGRRFLANSLFRRLLSRFLGETLNIRVCPDEAVALEQRAARGEGKALIDVLSCDLCIGTAEGGVTVIVKGYALPLSLQSGLWS